MALTGVDLETLVSESDALTTRQAVKTVHLFERYQCSAVFQSYRIYSLSDIYYLWYLAKYKIKHTISILARVNIPQT